MTVVAIAILTTFLVAMFGGMPIAFCLGIASVLGLYLADFPMVVLAQRMIAGTQSFSLLAIPGFILAGDLMMHGGLSRRLVTFCQSLVRHVTGGLGMVTVLSATFFAAISGSAPATTAAIGGIMIPEMEKRGWRRDFSASLSAAAGPIGQMIPPSIPMIIWGVVSEQSISQLFLAGIIPGLMIAAGLMLVCYLVARGNPNIPLESRSTIKDVRESLWDGKWSLLAPVIILGGIYGSIFTPTEASAVAVFYALIIGLFVHRELKPRELVKITNASMRTSAIVCFIIALASAFGWLVAIEQLPSAIASGILSLSNNPIVILLILNLFLLFIGAIMDNIAAMIILGTTLTSIGTQLNLDPIHLGAMVVINLAIGMATPPFGYSLFVASAISKLSIERLSIALWPMLVVSFIVLMLVTYIPGVTLLLPSLLR
ncbi:TRAP transporter large permease [Ochrobactrum sp. SFR4]|uniref:TRAP transporter large permease n=1 Tax=Ochrobactrum sp. SFR4 TaxID=2717368 RepID=UPI001C8B5736|nr:TRAP transporter large permease [Ochrobactrum sp. SFR4]MBX8827409.1 TRAP transporter large permease [Ochrobactrum sp. SFR4]